MRPIFGNIKHPVPSEMLRGHEGELCTLTSHRDLAFYWDLRKYIGEDARLLRFIKVTKRGEAFVQDYEFHKVFYSVPCRNIQFV